MLAVQVRRRPCSCMECFMNFLCDVTVDGANVNTRNRVEEIDSNDEENDSEGDAEREALRRFVWSLMMISAQAIDSE